MQYQKLGLAFCIGLAKEAFVVAEIFMIHKLIQGFDKICISAIVIFSLSQINFFAQINILNSINDLDSLINRFLESFSTKNQACATCTFVDYSSFNSILKVIST